MSETPISDGTPHNVGDLGMLCRKLERELNEARTRIKELADIGEDLAGHVKDCECQRWPRSLKDWEKTVKRCSEGIK
jgi:hypothetical protein